MHFVSYHTEFLQRDDPRYKYTMNVPLKHPDNEDDLWIDFLIAFQLQNVPSFNFRPGIFTRFIEHRVQYAVLNPFFLLGLPF